MARIRITSSGATRTTSAADRRILSEEAIVLLLTPSPVGVTFSIVVPLSVGEVFPVKVGLRIVDSFAVSLKLSEVVGVDLRLTDVVRLEI